MRIGPAANVARLNVDETVSALWQFANALGLLTDVIGERTAAAGVTIDGLLVRDSGIPEAAVTDHEAALAIVLAQLTDGANLTEDDVAEVISALWTFAHASGLSTDDIVERTGGAGVTIDGVLLKDIAVRLENATAASNIIMRASVVGDAELRFSVLADGWLQWGDGASPRDTSLYRAAADELATDDDFNVGGVLDLAGDLELSERSPAQITANQNNYPTDTQTVQRLDTDAPRTISGFGGGRSGRVLIIVYIGGTQLTLLHNDGASAVANRMYLPSAGDVILTSDESLTLWYDIASTRWRAIAVAN